MLAVSILILHRARSITTNFGFVFRAGPVQLPSPPNSQQSTADQQCAPTPLATPSADPEPAIQSISKLPRSLERTGLGSHESICKAQASLKPDLLATSDDEFVPKRRKKSHNATATLCSSESTIAISSNRGTKPPRVDQPSVTQAIKEVEKQVLVTITPPKSASTSTKKVTRKPANTKKTTRQTRSKVVKAFGNTVPRLTADDEEDELSIDTTDERKILNPPLAVQQCSLSNTSRARSKKQEGKQVDKDSVVEAGVQAPLIATIPTAPPAETVQAPKQPMKRKRTTKPAPPEPIVTKQEEPANAVRGLKTKASVVEPVQTCQVTAVGEKTPAPIPRNLTAKAGRRRKVVSVKEEEPQPDVRMPSSNATYQVAGRVTMTRMINSDEQTRREEAEAAELSVPAQSKARKTRAVRKPAKSKKEKAIKDSVSRTDLHRDGVTPEHPILSSSDVVIVTTSSRQPLSIRDNNSSSPHKHTDDAESMSKRKKATRTSRQAKSNAVDVREDVDMAGAEDVTTPAETLFTKIDANMSLAITSESHAIVSKPPNTKQKKDYALARPVSKIRKQAGPGNMGSTATGSHDRTGLDFALFDTNVAPLAAEKPRKVQKRILVAEPEMDLDWMLDGIATLAHRS